MGISGTPELMKDQGGYSVASLWKQKHHGITERPVLGTDVFSSPVPPNQGSPLFILVCSSSAVFIWGLRKVDFTLWSCYHNRLWMENCGSDKLRLSKGYLACQ